MNCNSQEFCQWQCIYCYSSITKQTTKITITCRRILRTSSGCVTARVKKPLMPPAIPYAIFGISMISGSYPTIFTLTSSKHNVNQDTLALLKRQPQLCILKCSDRVWGVCRLMDRKYVSANGRTHDIWYQRPTETRVFSSPLYLDAWMSNWAFLITQWSQQW